MATEGFEYNKKLSDTNYSPQQPFSNLHYRPDIDVKDECSNSQIQFFQNIIGILRWTVELGRIDIDYEISVLSRYLAQESFHLQMRISFHFLLAKYLRTSLLIMRTRIFLNSPLRRGYIHTRTRRRPEPFNQRRG